MLSSQHPSWGELKLGLHITAYLELAPDSNLETGEPAPAIEELQTPELTITPRKFLSGMRGFIVVCMGQLVSFLGTGMTRFALTIWAWQVTGEATALALVGFFTYAPTILMIPVAGALVDRSNRKLLMILSDSAAGLATVVVLLLQTSGRLEIWHLYVTGAFSGVFQSFQYPAYAAAVTMMVPKEQYTRANGMRSLVSTASSIVAPILAGVLIGTVGITGVMIFDVFTFVVAICALLPVHIPQPPSSEERGERRSLWRDSVYGFRYIYERPSLLGLQLMLFMLNLVWSLSYTLLAPMVLTRTGNDTIILGTVQSAFGVGGVIGSLIISAWGGPRRKINGVMVGLALNFIFGQMLMGLGRGPVVWAAAAFSTLALLPISNGCTQAIWMSKISPEIQGRVFAARRLMSQITNPLGTILAGPLADHVIGPSMMPGGALAPIFGWLVGTGPGTGMSLMFLFNGTLGVIIIIAACSFSSIRNIEDLLPDHDATTSQETPGG
jgi:DHA3 family macrolide efflux protein-like MFS transporter